MTPAPDLVGDTGADCTTPQASWPQRCLAPDLAAVRCAPSAITLITLCAQGLSTDARPEVRNSGVRTLFAVVAGQGGRMSRRAWEETLWQMLFPLLRSVHHTAATASREEACPARRALHLTPPRPAIMA